MEHLERQPQHPCPCGMLLWRSVGLGQPPSPQARPGSLRLLWHPSSEGWAGMVVACVGGSPLVGPGGLAAQKTKELGSGRPLSARSAWAMVSSARRLSSRHSCSTSPNCL